METFSHIVYRVMTQTTTTHY